MNKIKIPGYDTYLQENIMWERTLDFYLQQNAFLKTKLSQAVDGTINRETVAQAEHFQNSFILADDNIKDLRVDIESLQRTLKDGVAGSMDEKKLAERHRILSNEMNNFEKKFAVLKNEFVVYMKNIQ